MKFLTKTAVVVAVISILLTGCTTGSERRLAMKKGPTMASVYHGRNSGQESYRSQPIGRGDGDLSGYTRDADNEIQQLFPTIENPTIHIYVFPHLRGDLPVPGYTTSIPLYDRAIIYALPGEAEE